MAMAADGDGGKSTFRWLNAARYFVASLVTVLILAVIVNAIKVVLRPEALAFSVVRGSVFSRRIARPPTLYFDLNLRANNPSGRARMFYSNFTAYLFDKDTPASSPNPGPDSLFFFHVRDNVVKQHGKVEALVQAKGIRTVTMADPLFDRMYYNKTDAIINDVTMRLEGSLVTEVRSGYNTTPEWSTYYCGPLVFGGDPDDEASQNMPDVNCREVQHGTTFW